MADETNPAAPVQGEGDYVAARKFQKDEREFVKDEARVQQGAKAAEEALDGPEGAELEKARQDTTRGRSR